MGEWQEKKWVEETVSKLEEKFAWTSDKWKGKIPFACRDGEYNDMSGQDAGGDGISWWTNGFWGGTMWQLYAGTGEEKYGEYGRLSEPLLDRAIKDYYGLHHDVGFMWMPTAVADYRLTKDETARKRGLMAANLLAGRFNPAGNFIRAWNSWGDPKNNVAGWAIIDCLMNLSLLYWASEETKDPRYRQIAMLHTDTVLREFIRPDGSVKHIVVFDPETGEALHSMGGQGYAHGSSWTRGQSWAIYGLMIGYHHTGEKRYMDAAKQVANYWIASMDEDGLIPVDFRQPKTPRYMDDTAAAIASCGLLELADSCKEWDRDMYRNAAVRMLKALTDHHCDWTKENDAVLTHCSGSYGEETHHYGLVYADYYFLEAMYRLAQKGFFIW